MIVFKKAWLFFRKCLCWILIFNQGFVGVAQAFHGTIRFQVTEKGDDRELSLIVKRQESVHHRPKTIFKALLTPTYWQDSNKAISNGVGILYLGKVPYINGVRYFEDTWLIRYADVKTGTNLSFQVNQKGNLRLHALDSPTQKVKISSLGLMVLEQAQMNAMKLSVFGAEICNKAHLDIHEELVLSAPSGRIINNSKISGSGRTELRSKNAVNWGGYRNNGTAQTNQDHPR